MKYTISLFITLLQLETDSETDISSIYTIVTNRICWREYKLNKIDYLGKNITTEKEDSIKKKNPKLVFS